ncbi:hypothetical protein Smar_0073 [Staphylothermus marinus F1]|uniref:Uncharacterized protein n=1 Tax=Staphylothermus marinus (strain ATCC 43588 / DSM 3639 / JCM 9404 / F1) TaxID=399550 RepID=A3DKM6_STAMF|nr:hypothetical protein Smar_0073 [Staphylothermus marinus F1]
MFGYYGCLCVLFIGGGRGVRVAPWSPNNPHHEGMKPQPKRGKPLQIPITSKTTKNKAQTTTTNNIRLNLTILIEQGNNTLILDQISIPINASKIPTTPILITITLRPSETTSYISNTPPTPTICQVRLLRDYLKHLFIELIIIQVFTSRNN